jgi:hypothetical protein
MFYLKKKKVIATSHILLEQFSQQCNTKQKNISTSPYRENNITPCLLVGARDQHCKEPKNNNSIKTKKNSSNCSCRTLTLQSRRKQKKIARIKPTKKYE